MIIPINIQLNYQYLLINNQLHVQKDLKLQGIDRCLQLILEIYKKLLNTALINVN